MAATETFMMRRSDLFDTISDALAVGGNNHKNLDPDGTVGGNMRKAAWEFLWGYHDKNGINLIIRLLKAGGYNDALEPDGDVGTELTKAVNALLEENGQKPITEDELAEDEYLFDNNDDGDDGPAIGLNDD